MPHPRQVDIFALSDVVVGPQNARRGEFARHKMKGKRAVELGAGMGLGGLAFAMLGADVLLTDVAAVLPLLRRNYENNMSPPALRGERVVLHVGLCCATPVTD